MAARIRGYWVIILGAALLLAGCAGGPPPRRPVVAPPLPSPPAIRTPQEYALDQAVSSFNGAPYRSGGTTPSGVDCSGLVQTSFHHAGINLPRTVAQQYGEGQPVSLSDLRFGDVVFFNRYCQTRSRDFYTASIFDPFVNQHPCHNGIYLGHGRFIHASPHGVYIGHLDAKVWRLSFVGARRYLPNGPPDR